MSMEKSIEKLTFSEFSPISAADWMEQINKDLKGKKWEDYLWEIEPGLVIDPAQFNPDKSYQPLFANQSVFWITQELPVSEDLEKANSQLLRLLMEGVSAPKLVFEGNMETDGWMQLLDQVKVSYLRFQLCFSNLENAFSSLQALPVDYQNLIGVVEVMSKNGESASNSLKDQFGEKFRGLQFHIISSSTPGYVDQLADLLGQINNRLLGSKDKNVDCSIEIHMGNKILAEIARFRAMRLLIELLFQQYQLDTSGVFYQATVNRDALSGEPELDLIRLTSMTLAARIGGANAFSYPILSGDKTAFHQRISSNIAHIYDLESHVGKVGDPLAGSYFIETLTDQIASAAWKKFQEQA